MRILLLTLALTSVAATPADAPLDIEAGHLELLPGQGEARFSGGVVVRQANFTLRCAAIVARYDAQNRVETLEASGEVRLEADGWSAVAGHARYERETETLSLTGQPTLIREKDVLRGERIVFWLAEERMVVEKVRGRIRAPRLSKITPAVP
jgi:lipopolysaccharide export system protein LptA